MSWWMAAVALLLLSSAAEAACTSTNECASKLNGYAVLNGQGLDASKLNGYAVLNGLGLNVSKIAGYAVLCNTPGIAGCPAGPHATGSMMLMGVGQ